ncbi:MAG: alpha/beta fold hydrolase [Mariprofundus sp.]
MKPLVFLHGWAQSQQIWFQQHESFPDALYLNLPGHGGADDHQADAWVESIVQQLPAEPSVLVGWSLGGMLALQIAHTFSDRVAALALVSTTPCFRQKTDWQTGCETSLFEAFEHAVATGSGRLLNRFFSLMLHGDNLNRHDYNHLARLAVDREHPASASGLDNGLALLGSLDIRSCMADISVPTLVMHGDQDAIVSVNSGRWLAKSIANSRMHLFEKCGHAPFLTQTNLFNKNLFNWWKTL